MSPVSPRRSSTAAASCARAGADAGFGPPATGLMMIAMDMMRERGREGLSASSCRKPLPTLFLPECQSQRRVLGEVGKLDDVARDFHDLKTFGDLLAFFREEQLPRHRKDG